MKEDSLVQVSSCSNTGEIGEHFETYTTIQYTFRSVLKDIKRTGPARDLWGL
jgi:hypothetical protein